MKIYVGNLSQQVQTEDLRPLFEPFGKVENISVVKDRRSGASKGFGFVEMSSQTEAKSAIDGLDGTELNGQKIRVNEARPRTENRRSGGRGY